MRLVSCFWVSLVAVGVALGCGDDEGAKTPAAGGLGGTTGGAAGKGGGTRGTMAGEGGMGESAAGGEAGSGVTGGRGGSGGTTGGTGVAAGEAGQGGEAGGGAPFHGVYVGTNGSDQGKSTRDDPYASLAKAASVATSGDTIVLLDGNYAEAGPVSLADGVDLVAEHAGQAKLSGSGETLLEAKGSSNIGGLRFDGYATVVLAEGKSGTVRVSDSSFDNCANAGASALEVGGQAKVELSTDTSNDWGTCPSLGHAYADGALNVSGGVMHFTSPVGTTAFTVDDQAALALSDLTAADGNRPLLLLNDASVASLVGCTVVTLGDSVATINGAPSLSIIDSDLSIDPSATIAYACIQSNANAAGVISISDSFLHGCSTGINGSPPAQIDIVGTEIYDMSFDGLEFSSGDGGVINIIDSNFHDTNTFGARFFGGGGGANLVVLTVRGTTFENATESLRLAAADGSTFDLGTLADPGNNTFGATTTGVAVLTSDATFISAVGNNWAPNQQGADDSGHYAAVGQGAVLEVTSGNGANYNVGYGATLRLAENP